jgi:hypothetical protein
MVLAGCHAFGSESPGASPPDAAPSATSGATDIEKTQPCNGRLACERVLFVTAQQFDGNLAGVEGGNARCNTTAQQSRHPRIAHASFHAWLAVPDAPAITNVVNGTARYVAPSGQVVTPDLKTLVANGFSHVPSDENGIEIGGAVWSGVDNLGSCCGGWLSNTQDKVGMRGQAEGTGSSWEATSTQLCSERAHLYCFED